MFTLPGKADGMALDGLRVLFHKQPARHDVLVSVQTQIQLLQRVLGLRPLSPALDCQPGCAVAVLGMEFFNEIAHVDSVLEGSEPTTYQQVLRIIDVLFDCLDRINLEQETVADNDLRLCIVSAMEAVGFAMANNMTNAHVNTLLQDSKFNIADTLVTEALATMKFGSMHPSHVHPLVPSNGNVAFCGKSSNKSSTATWRCTICHRTAIVKTDVVYRCAGCNVNLCKECFTRIPNSSKAPVQVTAQSKRRLCGLWTYTFETLCTRNRPSAALAIDTAMALRRRMMELPLTSGTNMLPILAIFHEMLTSATFRECLIRSPLWLPDTISGKAMEDSSFLGPFFRHCSLPDDAVPGDLLCSHSDQTKTKTMAMLRETNTRVQAALHAIVSSLLDHGGVVQEAILCWLACAIESNSIRRRLGHSPVECASDGFLTNLAAVALAFIKDVDIDTLDASYHGPTNTGRISFADMARLVKSQSPPAPVVSSSVATATYYPHYESNLIVVCDHCQEKDFIGVRYKCAFCDDYDLCSNCFESFYEQNHVLRHSPDHLFIRLSIPLPQVATWPFRKCPELPEDLEEVTTTPTCDVCACQVATRGFQCGHCDRFVCAACVEMEERLATTTDLFDDQFLNPHRLHAPGHHYFVVPPNMWAARPHLRFNNTLYPPQFLFPRTISNDATEWWYLTMKCLHVGPVLTMMRYVSVHREYQQLKALCNMENRSRQQGSGSRRSSRSNHNMNLNANHLRVEELMKTKTAMEVQIFAPSLLNEVFVYYSRVASWLLSLLGVAPLDDNSTCPEVIPSVYTDAPEAVLCNLADVVYILGVHPCEGVIWSQELLAPILKLIFFVIAHRPLTNSPHIRVQLIRALLSLAPLTKDNNPRSPPLLYDLLATDPFLRSKAVSCLLQCHTDLESYSSSTGGDTSWGLLPARLSTTLLLRWLWNNAAQQPTIIAQQDSHSLVLLFSGVLNDITRLLDEATVKVTAMRRLQELQDSPHTTTGAYFQPSMMQSYLALHFNKARTTFRVLIECLELLAWMASAPALRAVLCRRSLVDQTATTLCFVVASLETQLHPTRWGFSGEIFQDGMLALAEALIIVVRCAGFHTTCPEASSWKLSNYAGILMEEKIGDLDVHQRWKLSSCVFRLEKDNTIPPPPALEEILTDEELESDDSDTTDEDRILERLEHRAATRRQLADEDRAQKQLSKRFLSALAADGRFESVRFRRAAVLLRSDPSLTNMWREKFVEVVDHTETLMQMQAEMESQLGSVPDEYLDPILHTLMLHPVQLPSGHIVDRAMIERHLLSASVNPFSREPLTMEMLLPCTELQAQIHHFVRSKLATRSSSIDEEWGLGWDNRKAATTMVAISASVRSMLSNRKKRLLFMGLITLLAFCVVLAAVISTVTASSAPSAPSDQQTKENADSIAEKYSAPTTAPTATQSTTPDPSSQNNSSTTNTSTDSSTANGTSTTTTTLQPTTLPPQPRVCSATDATTPCYVPPASSAYCRLDMQLDAHLQYVIAPFASNANAGFAMDRACAAGERCAYACMSPYLPTSNGWSTNDCIPYRSLCPAYSPATARGGLQCVNGKTVADNPSQPLCVLGLNTSFVKSYLPKSVATCQVVNHGTAMAGFDLSPNQASQLASPPQWYWRGRGAKYYTGLPGVGNDTACQRNFDRLSLNAAGIDTMPYTLGGGSLFGSPCAECGQHTLAFGENFDSKKKYSSFPGYGIRVRNCNDFGCGDVQCDATYAFNPITGDVEAYWVKYNTVFSSTSVGCVADTVMGYGWAPSNGFAKYTLYEYYPVTINGQQTSTCSTCSAPSTFVPSTCGKIRTRTPPRFGTGSNPAMYVCTPVGAAVGLQSTIKILSSSTPSSSELSATVIAEIVVASVLCLVVIGIAAKAKSLQTVRPPVPHPMNAPECTPSNDISFTPDRRSSVAATRFEARASTTGGFVLT